MGKCLEQRQFSKYLNPCLVFKSTSRRSVDVFVLHALCRASTAFETGSALLAENVENFNLEYCSINFVIHYPLFFINKLLNQSGSICSFIIDFAYEPNPNISRTKQINKALQISYSIISNDLQYT